MTFPLTTLLQKTLRVGVAAICTVLMYTGNGFAADLIWSTSTTPCTVNCWGGALWGHTPPTVSLASPANNTVLNAPGSLSLTASFANVTTVEFFMGGTPVGIDTTAPYAAAVSGLSSGQYSFTAVATDSLGARTESAAVTVIVNQPGSDLVWSTASSPCRVNCWGGTLWHASASPAVSISSPANDTIVDSPGSVTLTAGATDSGTVTQVAFY
jgi:chitinase